MVSRRFLHCSFAVNAFHANVPSYSSISSFDKHFHLLVLRGWSPQYIRLNVVLPVAKLKQSCYLFELLNCEARPGTLPQDSGETS